MRLQRPLPPVLWASLWPSSPGCSPSTPVARTDLYPTSALTLRICRGQLAPRCNARTQWSAGSTIFTRPYAVSGFRRVTLDGAANSIA